MNGQMMNYDKYIKSLNATPEPRASTKIVAINYRELVTYAKEKGKNPSELSEKEKNMFVLA